MIQEQNVRQDSNFHFSRIESIIENKNSHVDRILC